MKEQPYLKTCPRKHKIYSPRNHIFCNLGKLDNTVDVIEMWIWLLCKASITFLC